MRNLTSCFAVLAFSACASMGTGQGVPAEHHQNDLPISKSGAGTTLASGPLTLLQAQLVPGPAEAHAALWVSRDATCPPAGTSAFADLTRVQSWSGSEQLGAGDYLCAAQRGVDGAASLEWWTAK